MNTHRTAYESEHTHYEAVQSMLVTRLVKLRWMGLEDEARKVERHLRRGMGGRTALKIPADTD